MNNTNRTKHFNPTAGDVGEEETETIEILPAEEPLSVPTPVVEPEKVPA